LDIKPLVVANRIESVVTEQEIIENTDVVAILEEFLHDVVPDIARTARHEYTHTVSIPADR
jgi:tRNA C32,U32 (ribose-2'-O)-methylase TrmJ